ncbi:MAG: DMT family transporter [Nitrospinaceae bacterium]|jgi:drug/metabolite transporter (DMT)-like permease|nr:DMT family transporter [Nitrospinaceae bacterium]MBT3433631.1 DMT family transporter [Nitrospinaceae bacterium]MBT3822716.1 DMT family transporter [Nitrospinaceae bacterium]MBT4093411.1 DMT family transporter [Nitrospinaceae bacterium]MBT4431286.1 DMT family transporter [Nitrospinaceae bacterium]
MIDLLIYGIRGEYLATISSLLYAITLISIRAGMAGGTPFAALLTVNTIVSIGGLTVAAIRGTLFSTALAPVLWFVVTGICAQGIGTLTHYFGIERMGVSRATAVQSITPLWGVLFAFVVLGERPGIAVISGTVAIVAGVVLLSLPEKRFEEGGWVQRAVLFPLVSSVVYAFVPIFAKFAFAYQQTPVLGLGVAFGSASIVMFLVRRKIPGGGVIQANSRSFGFFVLAGVMNMVGAIIYWSALVAGSVSTILPISRLYPLWVLVLGALFLGRMEKISIRVVLAGVIVVFGGVLITIYQ